MAQNRPAFRSRLLRLLLLVCLPFWLPLVLALPSGQARGEPAPLDLARAAQAARIADPDAATEAYLAAVPADRQARTRAYSHEGYVLEVASTLLSAALMAALLLLGVSARMRDRAERLTRFRSLQVTLYWVQFFLLFTVTWFPITLFRSYYREKSFGLLTQSLPDWLLDQVKGTLVGCILGALLVVSLYAVLRRAPRRWWIWGTGVVVAFSLFSVAITPVFIAPLFNKFIPLRDATLRQQILAMAHEHGVPAKDVYEVDESRRTERISAYVFGVLGTMRIVIFDTTLRRCTPAEVRSIMGHEMGHYVLNHVWKGIAFLAGTMLLGFLFVRWGFVRATEHWPQMGVRDVSDVAGLPLFALLFIVFFAAIGPVELAFTRAQELEADTFGLYAAREPDAEATTDLKLGEYRELDPDPLVELFFFDHPSGRRRILNAMEWKHAHPPGPADNVRSQ
jgi:STE24 endopeptidase